MSIPALIDYAKTVAIIISKDSLEEFLYNQLIQGLLNCNDIGNNQPIMFSYYNWVTYHILHPVFTMPITYRLKKRTKKKIVSELFEYIL